MVSFKIMSTRNEIFSFSLQLINGLQKRSSFCVPLCVQQLVFKGLDLAT